MAVKNNSLIRTVLRIVAGGIVAVVVWYMGIMIVFGPAQQVLANPEYQSQKFLTVFTQMEPLPRMIEQPIHFFAGFLIVGIAFSMACHIMGRWIPGTTLKKGVTFGFVAWLLINPWFEFYLPWNVMHEPLLLVLLEMVLWLVVLMIVGIAVIYVQSYIRYGS